MRYDGVQVLDGNQKGLKKKVKKLLSVKRVMHSKTNRNFAFPLSKSLLIHSNISLRNREMARFSADEGPSSPRRKKQRTHNSIHDSDVVEEESADEEEEGSSAEEEEEECDDDDDDDDDVVSEEEEEGADENTTQMAVVEPPRSSSNFSGPTRNGAICVTLTDPEVLDCPICYESLTIPVFQVFLY